MNKIYNLMLLSHILCFIAGCCFVLLSQQIKEDIKKNKEL